MTPERFMQAAAGVASLAAAAWSTWSVADARRKSLVATELPETACICEPCRIAYTQPWPRCRRCGAPTQSLVATLKGGA